MTELEKKDWIADLMYELVQDLNRWDKEEIVTVCKKIIAVCNLQGVKLLQFVTLLWKSLRDGNTRLPIYRLPIQCNLVPFRGGRERNTKHLVKKIFSHKFLVNIQNFSKFS